MDQVLQGINGIQCYLGDIIISGKTNSKHMSTLDKVLQRFRRKWTQGEQSEMQVFAGLCGVPGPCHICQWSTPGAVQSTSYINNNNNNNNNNK